MTHAKLVERAARWLRTQGCQVIITELGNGSGETPDAIGWKLSTYARAESILVEVKVSRSDFLADAKKSHRHIGAGMGSLRYFLAPNGMIAVTELPPGWGLIELKGRTVIHRAWPDKREADRAHEIDCLASALRRILVTPDGHRSVRCRLYQFFGVGDAQASIGALAGAQS